MTLAADKNIMKINSRQEIVQNSDQYVLLDSLS